MVGLLGWIKERASDSRIVGDKQTIEVGKAKEGMYFLDFDGGHLGDNTIKFDWIHGKLTGFHNHPKIFDFWDIKLAFLKLQVEVKLSHILKDTTSSFDVCLWIGRGDEEIIHVDDEPSFSNHISK